MIVSNILDPLISEHYNRFLKSSNTCKSPLAIRDYLLSLEMFCRMLSGNIFDSIRDYRSFHWTIEDLAERTQWPDGRSKKRWAGRTIYKTATECVVFFRWAKAFDFTRHTVALEDPEVGHLFQKGNPKEPEFFDWNDPELKKLLKDPNNSAKRRAMYEILRSSGIRPSEFGRLLKTDYQRNLLTLSRRKGGKPGYGPVDEDAQKYMAEYLEGLELHYQGPWLFPKDDYSGPINGHGLWKMMSNHGKKLGIHFYPYRLRHSLAGELADRGVHPMIISDIYGHSDHRTTAIYTHISKEKIGKVYSSPRSQPA